MGDPGHTVGNCKDLKHKGHALINCKAFTFTPITPNVRTNLMSAHARSLVNAIEEIFENRHKVIIIPV